jgi:hypothetical protein
MAENKAPIKIGFKILENAVRIAHEKGRNDLVPAFEGAIKELKEYERNGHSTLDAHANEIVFRPFGNGNHELQEEAMSGIDDSSA